MPWTAVLSLSGPWMTMKNRGFSLDSPNTTTTTTICATSSQSATPTSTTNNNNSTADTLEAAS